MKKGTAYEPIDLNKTLAKMKGWAKEKDRRYRQQKKFAEKMFGSLIKKLGLDS